MEDKLDVYKWNKQQRLDEVIKGPVQDSANKISAIIIEESKKLNKDELEQLFNKITPWFEKYIKNPYYLKSK